MNFLFIDLECAVCTSTKKRICSFGYVLTDSNLNIIKEEDILINPKRFSSDIMNNVIAYKKEELENSKEFDFYYDYIKELLSDKNNVVIGQDIKNDASYLIDTCKRYQKDSIDFVFYDFAEVYRNYKNLGQISSLEIERTKLGVTTNQGEKHTSLRDAQILYECFRNLVRIQNLSPITILKKYRAINGSVKNGKLFLLHDFKNNLNNMSNTSFNKTLFNNYLSNLDLLKPINELYLGKKINISTDFSKKHFREMLYIAYLIKCCGGTYSIINNCDIYATSKSDFQEVKLEYPNVTIFELNEFLTTINYNKDNVYNHYDKLLKKNLLLNKEDIKFKQKLISKEFKRLK